MGKGKIQDILEACDGLWYGVNTRQIGEALLS